MSLGDLSLPYSIKMKSLLFMLISQLALAQEWWNNPPQEDTQYKYYLGVGDHCSSIKLCREQAFDDALKNYIRENFGFETEVQTDTYLTDTSDATVSHIKENSRQVHLKEFEQVKSYINDDKKDSIFFRALYRIPKHQIEQEKIRLASTLEKQRPEPHVPNSQGYMGGIDIVTNPPGAMVSLDGTPLFATPFYLSGQIKAGSHEITLDHPFYDTIQEKLIVLPGHITKLRKLLVPGKGYLSVNTTPMGARIFINGKDVGASPVLMHQLISGQDYSIRIEHPDCVPFILKSYRVSKNEKQIENWTLQKRKGRLLIKTNPPFASVEVPDSSHLPSSHLWIVDAGETTVKVFNDGFETSSESIKVLPEQTKTISITLQKSMKPIEPEPTRFSNFNLQKLNVELLSLELEARSFTLSDKNYPSQKLGAIEGSIGFSENIMISIALGSILNKKQADTDQVAGTKSTILSTTMRQTSLWLTTSFHDPNFFAGVGIGESTFEGTSIWVDPDVDVSKQKPLNEKFTLSGPSLNVIFLVRNPNMPATFWALRGEYLKYTSTTDHIIPGAASSISFSIGYDWKK